MTKLKIRTIVYTAVYAAVVCITGLCFQGCKEESEIVSGPDRYMSVDEIKPGMKGFGRTVFKDDRIETFDVEIIGVMHNWSPGGDMILAEVHHDVVDEAGIIAGMSGSPIYINGKLIGALAYGWGFQKRAITGITPIHEMLIPKKGKHAGNAGLFRDAEEERTAATAHIDNADMMPLALPLSVNGVSPGFRSFIKKELGRRFPESTLFLAGGAGGNAAGMDIGPLEEGSAVAVKLIEGDFDIAAVGTLTCIENNTVYAFGHPFYMEGNVTLPMAKAWVHTVIPSLRSSFKLTSTGETVGEFNLDYAQGLRGNRTKKPDLVPLKVSLRNKDSGESTSYSFRTVHEKRWTSFLVFLAVLYAVDEAEIVGTDVSVWIESSIEAEGIPPVTGKDFFVSWGTPGWGSAGPLWSKIDFLMDNEYKPLAIRNVTLDLEVAGGKQVKRIERFIAEKTKVKPGGTVEFILSLRQYGKPVSRETITVAVPEDIPEGPVRLNIYNGLYAGGYDIERAPGLADPASIEQIARLLSDTYGANTMIAEFSTRAEGVVVEGREFQDIPQSVLDIYKGLNHPRVSSTRYKLWRRTPMKRDDIIMGGISVVLDVSKYHRQGG